MKIAIVNPSYLYGGGGERVLDAMAELYPSADFFFLFKDNKIKSPSFIGRKIILSNLNPLFRLVRIFTNIPFCAFVPLLPSTVESLDLSEYDLVISLCGPAMIGVHTRQDAVHIAYIHSPSPAWWHLYAQYQKQVPWFLRRLYIHYAIKMRIWEFIAMQRVDYIISNSNYVARRVRKYFRRESTIIYPPVDTSIDYIASQHGDYYLSVSRLYEAKRIDLLIHACNELQRKLLVVGTGSETKRLRALAGPTIRFLGYVPDNNLSDLYANCRAFLFAADEDFGIAPLEAQSFGRPVIAYGHGGALETVRVGDKEKSNTGLFFLEQTVESVKEAILRFEANESKFIPREIQMYARQFDTVIFKEKMRNFVDAVWIAEKNQ